MLGFRDIKFCWKNFIQKKKTNICQFIYNESIAISGV